MRKKNRAGCSNVTLSHHGGTEATKLVTGEGRGGGGGLEEKEEEESYQ